MGRIRTIKPEFPQSESVGRLSRDARLLFVMLWTIVDDEGRARAAPRMLASLLYPYDDDAKTHIVQWLFELEREGCIKLYDVDGNAYLQIEKWLEHQKIDRPSKSRLPAISQIYREASPKPREPSTTDLIPRTMDLGPSKLPAVAGCGRGEDPEFEEFWKVYKPPPNAKKPDARNAWLATGKVRPPKVELLRAVQSYLSWLGEESRKQKRDYPKQHPSTWLRGEVWNGFMAGADAPTPEQIEAAKDRADRLLKRGKYAETYQ